MTQSPDKWHFVAATYFYPTRFMGWGPEDQNEFAQRLRSAYEEGEKAGMEMAIHRLETSTFHRPTMGVVDACIAIIRAAKETKEPPSPS